MPRFYKNGTLVLFPKNPLQSFRVKVPAIELLQSSLYSSMQRALRQLKPGSFDAKNFMKNLCGQTLALLLSIFFCFFQEVNLDDETWFLQVVNRFISGEVLYRDIYFGATPLSVYLAGFLAKIFGSELLVIRMGMALYFSVSIWISFEIMKKLGIKRMNSILVVLAFFAFAHFRPAFGFSGYNALAKVFFLITFYFSLRFDSKQSLSNALWMGIFAGLCFLSKQNVGAISLFCAIASICFCRKQIIKFSGCAFIAFFFTVFAVLAPTWIQGGASSFLDYAIWNKPRYLSLEHIPLFQFPSEWNSYSIFLLIAPFLSFFLLFLRRENRNIPFRIFFLGSLMNLYPRIDDGPKMLCVSFFLIAIAYGFRHLQNRHPLMHFARGWVAIALILLIGKPLNALRCGQVSLSDVPHFRGLFLETNCHLHWKNMRQVFPSHFGKAPYFFLSTHAGFYYLLFDLENPTPFDYPIHSALGSSGEKEICYKVDTFKIKKIFRDHSHWSNWGRIQLDRRPFVLEEHLQKTLSEEPVIEEGCLQRVFQVYSHPEGDSS